MDNESEDYSKEELELDDLKTRYIKAYNDDVIDAYEALLLDLFLDLKKIKNDPRLKYELIVENEVLHEKKKKVISLLNYSCNNKDIFTHESLCNKVLELYGEPFVNDWNYDISEAPADGTTFLGSWGEPEDDMEIRWAYDVPHPGGDRHTYYCGWCDSRMSYPIEEPLRWKELE